MVAIAGTVPSQSQESRTPSGSPMWVTGAQALQQQQQEAGVQAEQLRLEPLLREGMLVL